MSNDPKQKIPSTPESKVQEPILRPVLDQDRGMADLHTIWFVEPMNFGTTSKQRHRLSIANSDPTSTVRLDEHVKSLTLVGSLQCVLATMRDDAKVDAKREFLIPLSVISHMLVKQ